MKKRLVFGIIVLLSPAGAIRAQDAPVSVAQPQTIVKPALLNPKEKIPDSSGMKGPRPPKSSADGKSLRAEENEVLCPRGPALDNLQDPDVASQIETLNQDNHSPEKYDWHLFKNLNYCHVRDGSRHWFGWAVGESFIWVLYQNGRFWWHDTYAERWLSFDKGYWWWRENKKDGQVEVYLEDGHYHLCDENGKLGEDMWTTGKSETATQPVPKEEKSSASDKEDHPGSQGKNGFGAGI